MARSCVPGQGFLYTGFPPSVYPSRDAVHVLLSERLSRPLALAALIEEGEDSITDSVFWLPDIARSALADWVRAAFDHWRTQDASRFPLTAEWRRADAWSSPEEIDARRQLAEFDAAESLRLSEVARARAHLLEGMSDLHGEGERWRALVSDTGDDLVAAVKKALEEIGFETTEADELPHHKGKKREDLRVRDGDWTCLVEVKGYSGAAKSNDLQQVSAAATAFALAEARAPDALWYVVNTHRALDPAQRPLCLAGREDDISAFGEASNGCVIDTRELFALRQQVALGRLGAAEARGFLRSARGRFAATPQRLEG